MSVKSECSTLFVQAWEGAEYNQSGLLCYANKTFSLVKSVSRRALVNESGFGDDGPNIKYLGVWRIARVCKNSVMISRQRNGAFIERFLREELSRE